MRSSREETQAVLHCSPLACRAPLIGVGLPHMVRGNSTLISVASPLSASVAWVVRGAWSCEVLDDVAYQLDPEVKNWLGSCKRAHVMQNFAPTCSLFISDIRYGKETSCRSTWPAQRVWTA